MGMLERRIAALEAKAGAPSGFDPVFMVSIVRFSDISGAGPGAVSAVSGETEWTRADDETEQEFTDRVKREAARLPRVTETSIVLVFLNHGPKDHPLAQKGERHGL